MLMRHFQTATAAFTIFCHEPNFVLFYLMGTSSCSLRGTGIKLKVFKIL